MSNNNEKLVKDIRRRTRKKYSSEEKMILKGPTDLNRTRNAFLDWSLSFIVLLFGTVVIAKDYAIWEIDKIKLQADRAYDDDKFDDALRYFQELSSISSGLDAALHQKYISVLITTGRINLAENVLMEFEKLYDGNHSDQPKETVPDVK